MGKYKVKTSSFAKDDLKSIAAYIRMDNPEAAAHMIAKIRTAISRLRDDPLIAAVPRDIGIARQGYRMLIVEPYLVFYIVLTHERVVVIHRVLHGKRDYASFR